MTPHSLYRTIRKNPGIPIGHLARKLGESVYKVRAMLPDLEAHGLLLYEDAPHPQYLVGGGRGYRPRKGLWAMEDYRC